jgi:maleylacetate reductase
MNSHTIQIVRSQRIIFGSGTIKSLGAECRALGERLLVIASSRWTELELEPLGLPDSRRLETIAQHVPAALATDAVARFFSTNRDTIVAIGGGSSIGLAKIVALETNAPIVAVPTTFSGSERTPVWGRTVDGAKVIGTDEKVVPTTVIYDEQLVQTLPIEVACESAMNALAHAVEGMWLSDNLLSQAICEQAIRSTWIPLRQLVNALDENASPPESVWQELQVGASLSGFALAVVGTGFHHAMAHELGGRFGLPHAKLHTLLLPYTSQLVANTKPLAIAKVSQVFGEMDGISERVPALLYNASRRISGNASLASLGIVEQDLFDAAIRLSPEPPPSGWSVDQKALKHFFRLAHLGLAPTNEFADSK